MEERKKTNHIKILPFESWPKGTQNVRRTIAILKAVGRYGNKGAKLSEIARSVCIPTPTVKRILTVMTMEGFLTVSPKSKRYYIGYDLYNLIKEARQFHLQDIYRIVLERLAEKTGDTIQLITRTGFDAVCLYQEEGASAVRIPYGIGSRLPLGIGCSGVVLLAFLPEEERNRVLAINESRYADRKLKPALIKAQIREIRKQGYNLRYESTVIEGIAGVGVPIPGNDQEASASISVISTSSRMAMDRCKEIVNLIQSEIYSLNL